jgi:hypothetical protein
MLVMYLCARGIDDAHASVCEGYRCWSCICVIGESMLLMYLCFRGIDVCHAFVCKKYRCW